MKRLLAAALLAAVSCSAEAADTFTIDPATKWSKHEGQVIRHNGQRVGTFKYVDRHVGYEIKDSRGRRIGTVQQPRSYSGSNTWKWSK